MTMKFFPWGMIGQQSAQTGWCLREWMEGDWMVTDFKIHHVADCAEDGEIRHRDILAACENDQQRARLVCISLEAWPKIQGRLGKRDGRKNPQPGTEEFFSTVLTGRHRYQLRIWFLAPFNVGRFNSQCLSFFTGYFEHRESLHSYRDANGVSFEEHLKSQEQAKSTRALTLP